MNVLTDLQINLIRGDLRREGIEMTDLEDDMLDHICCALEEEMEQFKSFDLAYAKVKEVFCPNGYREIQEETTQLLTIKFNKMKKIANAIGILGAAMVLFGTAFKFAHWPWANLLLLFGTGFLAFGYLPFMLIISLQQTDRLISRVRNVVGYLSGTSILTGLLFKIMHWPEATYLLLGGTGAFSLLFLPLYLSTTGKEKALKASPVATSILILISACMLFAFAMPKTSSSYHRAVESMSLNLDDSFTNNHARLLRTRKSIPPQDSTKEIKIADFQKQADAIIIYIDEMKSDFLSKLEVKPVSGKPKLPESLMVSYVPEIMNPPFEPGGKGLKYNGYALKSMVTDLQNDFLGISNQVIPGTEILDTSANGDWLDRYFYEQPVFLTFSNLTLIQVEITNLELSLYSVLQFH